MDMNCIAMEVVCADKAGLVLAGQNEDGRPEWLGTREQSNHFLDLLEWVAENGNYPWALTE